MYVLTIVNTDFHSFSLSFSLSSLLLTHLGDTQEAEILFPQALAPCYIVFINIETTRQEWRMEKTSLNASVKGLVIIGPYTLT